MAGPRRQKPGDITKLGERAVRQAYLDNIGFVPEPVMRDFVRLATGCPQPEKYPVCVVSEHDQLLVHGRDLARGRLVFTSLTSAIHFAPYASSVVAAGTWGRYLKLEPWHGRRLQESIANDRSWRGFRFYQRSRAKGRPRAEVLREYDQLDWREDRPPKGRDHISLELLWEQAALGSVCFHNPYLFMAASLPLWVNWKYGGVRRRSRLHDEPKVPEFPLRHEAAIMRDLAGLGYTLVRDQLLVDSFLGLATDRALVKARAKSYDSILRRLTIVSANDYWRQEQRLAGESWK